ncbi:4-hydroxy-3-methylbut-2-enyl diphosphate reductase [Acaryochloris marina]|uniref:4-hydroxy-3-methylbut-2-enyl diphosphate reductase n=1 Tax=Acaryochloris marina (strain MBIC 11017) TaxID=329726 RepID=ISPH_ACAM1|nr:4-hydroxy-3-methylbut-2-enyl diphosphate reductase [Acaryochloris marina]B0C4N8.1 RecName: Full=4-hydroxy-3-methylbut-2-enyl diphosphate reductase; Short=HMBPP reductase [Acaryochloris marina MBIC11017]ABW29921.1 4-hydroxy-3-methylbut-2-enyl diphosphate reductase [Acaryochloris marina MBIC11017]BDM78796.1 4-hydroxy-3-methylbut-2-enyl diphosphate reductase [Acaryochloris marina MBIC10699]
MDTKAFKRSLHKSEQYHRKGFGHEEEVTNLLQSEYNSKLIQQIRNNGYRLQQGDVTIHLAEAFGFCWGVERAIALAYETRRQFPQERIWITNEIIHNPSVNKNLRDMKVEFIPVQPDGQKDFTVVGQNDVVILPAFGASVQEMQLLHDKGCTIMDTTCPWVSKVWTSVEKHKKGSYTSIIHGKYKHEETIATSSFAGTYLVLLNLEEAEYVADYILNPGDTPSEREQRRADFMAKFANAHSPGFDPETDLERVGIANQTTMLKGETEQIGKLFERTVMRKYGPAQVNEHFLSFNTICDATQERQDAIFQLVDEPLDLMVVIGGFNSSNTTHLQEISIDKNIPSYHIDSVDRIGPGNRVEHKPLNADLTVTDNWLPNGPLAIGVTSGASTPDKVVSDIVEKIFSIKSASAEVVGVR